MMNADCSCGSEVPGSHEIDCPAYMLPWCPDIGDRVRPVESDNEAIVTDIRRTDEGVIWLSLQFESHASVGRPSDVLLVKPR